MGSPFANRFVTTDGQSAIISRCQAPSGGAQDQTFVRQLWVCRCGAPSDEKMTRPLVYNCCWSSPAQFYCLRFETPPTWRARSPYFFPPGTQWPWVPFSSPPTTRRATVEVSEPASTVLKTPIISRYITSGQTPQKTPPTACVTVAVVT
jgi:hypothetical protein